jgi:hypothetical protein
VHEQTVWDGHRRREIRPLQAACGVRTHTYSRLLQRAITDFAADVPFAQAAAKVKEHYGVDVPVGACRAVALRHAGACQGHVLPAVSAEPAPTLISETDGSMVPVVATDPGADDRRRTRRLAWQEAKLCLVQRPGETSTLVRATLGDAASCGAQMYALAEAAGLGKITHLHALGDGALWIADQVEQQFGRQARYLVDFWHVCEHLAPVAAALGPAGPAWLEAQKSNLRQGHPHAVLAALRACPEPPEHTDPTPARDAYRYLENRLHQLHYREALDAGLPIGSGRIESAHRSVIQARLKRPGAWWSPDHAQAMLDLRTLRHNQQWQSYWRKLKMAA